MTSCSIDSKDELRTEYLKGNGPTKGKSKSNRFKMNSHTKFLERNTFALVYVLMHRFIKRSKYINSLTKKMSRDINIEYILHTNAKLSQIELSQNKNIILVNANYPNLSVFSVILKTEFANQNSFHLQIDGNNLFSRVSKSISKIYSNIQTVFAQGFYVIYDNWKGQKVERNCWNLMIKDNTSQVPHVDILNGPHFQLSFKENLFDPSAFKIVSNLDVDNSIFHVDHHKRLIDESLQINHFRIDDLHLDFLFTSQNQTLFQNNCVKNIIGKKNFTAIFIQNNSSAISDAHFISKVIEISTSQKVSIEHVQFGTDTVSLFIKKESLNGKLQRLIETIKTEIDPNLLRIDDDIALIAILGNGTCSSITLLAKLFTSIEKTKIAIKMIDHCTHDNNILIGVENSDYVKCISTLSHEFFIFQNML